jgi:hypothetical protein
LQEESAVIVEQRTYDFQPGTLPEFFRLYEETGAREMQTRILGNLLAYYVSELGPLNQTVHLWQYDSLDDRARRRGALAAEPAWRDFLARVTPMIQRQESKILLPTPFSPGAAAQD